MDQVRLTSRDGSGGSGQAASVDGVDAQPRPDGEDERWAGQIGLLDLVSRDDNRYLDFLGIYFISILFISYLFLYRVHILYVIKLCWI